MWYNRAVHENVFQFLQGVHMNYPLYKKTSYMIFRTDLIGTRFTLGLAELIWAFTLFWPGNTFDRPTYEVMSHIVNEEAWGLIFLLSGVTQMTIALHGNVDHWFSRIFAGWNAALWVYIVISMYFSVYPPPAAISGETALALASVWIWVRPFILQRGEAYARKHAVSTTIE